jgi:hypothetical protein
MDITKTQQTLSKYSLWLMITTTIHHVYGAYIYHTPDRIHALAISIPVILLILYFDSRFSKSSPPHRTISTILYMVVIFVPTLLLIGVLEGIYNHIFKNILFSFRVSEHTIIHTFYGFYDPEIIEIPNDVFFEVTGIAQGFLAIPIAIYFARFSRYQINHHFSKDTEKKI